MSKIVRDWFFPAFLLFTIMAESIFHAYMVFQGLSVESGMLQWVFVFIFCISLLLLIKDYYEGWATLHPNRLLFILALLLLLFLGSSLTVFYVPERYIAYLLVFGVKSIPACIIGFHLARNARESMKRIDSLIPFFVLPIGIVIGLVGFKSATMSELVHNDDDTGGLNYQNLSYYMAEYYSYCAYYLFFSSAKGTTLYKYLKWIMLAGLFFFAVNCIMGGGRGAMVFLVIVTCFFIYMLYTYRVVKKLHILFLLIGISFIFVVLANKLDVFNSVGFQRVFNNITTDEGRTDLYQSAIYSFFESPIFGHGIGSVWWEVGFYSHNIFFDILVETGIVGLFILIFVGLKLYKRMFMLCKYNNCYFFFLLILIKATLYGMFSGYYLGVYHLWLIVGLVFIHSDSYYRKLGVF